MPEASTETAAPLTALSDRRSTVRAVSTANQQERMRKFVVRELNSIAYLRFFERVRNFVIQVCRRDAELVRLDQALADSEALRLEDREPDGDGGAVSGRSRQPRAGQVTISMRCACGSRTISP